VSGYRVLRRNREGTVLIPTGWATTSSVSGIKMPSSKARKRKKRAADEQKLTTPSGFRGSCSGGEDDEYVDKDNPLNVPSNSIHTGAPPSSKSVVCPLRVTDNDAEDKPSSEDTQKVNEETDTHPGCQPPFSFKQDDFPPLGDTVDPTSKCNSSVSNHYDVETLLLRIEKLELAFASSLPFSSTVSSDAAPVDELDCSTPSAPDCDDDDDPFIDEFESYLESTSPVLTPDHNLQNNLVGDRRAIQLDASTQTDSNDASSSSSSNETLTLVALDFISSNSPAVLIASSMLHQAAKTVQRSIRRFIGSSDTARQRAVATFQQKEDALFQDISLSPSCN
jgi:hypothetical protein